MKVKEESEKVGLKFNIQKTKTMASGPITSWQIGGETMETVTDIIILGPKITADILPTPSHSVISYLNFFCTKNWVMYTALTYSFPYSESSWGGSKSNTSNKWL